MRFVKHNNFDSIIIEANINMDNKIYTLNSYGRIEINIKKHMDERHITRNAMARAINTRFEVKFEIKR